MIILRTLALATAIVAAVSLVTAPAGAGDISPALQAELGAALPDQPVSVIVHLREQAPIAELDRSLSQDKATLARRHREVIHALQAAATSQNALLSDLDAGINTGEVAGYTSYWIANLVVVEASAAVIEAMAARPDVEWVEPNFRPVLIRPVAVEATPASAHSGARLPGIGVTPGLQAIRADEVWYRHGITGAGRVLGSCDTGVDGNHPALADRWRGANGHPWQECWLDVLISGTQFPVDYDSHGTHTTGTMTGLAEDDSIGVAPGAMWIASNPIDRPAGYAFDNAIIQVYQWFADPDGDPQTTDDVPDAVCNSWGVHGGYLDYENCDSRWWSVIDNCEAAGVVTVWAAGNEGPGSYSIRSPGDRATTLTNTFSVGAINATNQNFPYPIADFSSRGPTECVVPEPNRIKPEVAAPGVNVYSSVPGGGYLGGWSGTSMATPHVAGVVALMREADPDLDVETIKTMLMLSAVDHGIAGEDNSYGWGVVDALAAVELALSGIGRLSGTVSNGSYGDLPVADAKVSLLGSDYLFFSDENGDYGGQVAAGDYTARVTVPGFAVIEADLTIAPDSPTVQDFSLTDIAGPEITDLLEPLTWPDEVGPYDITASIFDLSSVASARVVYRVDAGDWQDVAMVATTAGYSAPIPGQPTGSVIDYYVWARDGAGLESVAPAGAPDTFLSVLVTNLVYRWDVEDPYGPGDPQWQIGIPGDDATNGDWIRAEPVGTWQDGEPAQTDQDHTPDPGYLCFVTENGEPGWPAVVSDVDGGCTTLLSPTFDLSNASRAFVQYQRWFAQIGNHIDDEFVVSVSDDGGTSWVDIDVIATTASYWSHVFVELTDLIDMTDVVVFRFLACDLGGADIVEAAIDDFSLETLTGGATSVVEENDQTPLHVVFGLAQNHPNPFNPVTKIRFSLPRREQVRLVVYGVDGRRVAELLRAQLPAGHHEVTWRGCDDSGQQVASGAYFYRLQAGNDIATRRMILLK